MSISYSGKNKNSLGSANGSTAAPPLSRTHSPRKMSHPLGTRCAAAGDELVLLLPVSSCGAPAEEEEEEGEAKLDKASRKKEVWRYVGTKKDQAGRYH
jgi:hypothetical protein